MVTFFPEDVAHEEKQSGSSYFDVASLSHLFVPTRREKIQSKLKSMRKDASRLMSSPPRSLRGETDLACTAVAVFFEARGEPVKGQRAVASVVLQRALTPDRWGDSACDVVRPVQFSFMQTRYGFPRITRQEGWKAAWARAVSIAEHVLAEGPMPELKGADHYHTRGVRPAWRLTMPRVAAIGNHLFYADPKSPPLPTEK